MPSTPKAMLRIACFFPAAAWGLQAFSASHELSSKCVLSRHSEESNCTKLVPPNLLFIGQAHSGSTSLYELMDFHHAIHGNIKEHHYWDKDIKTKKSGSAKTLIDYKNQFCVPCSTTIGVDATMEYINLGYEEFGGRQAVEHIRSQLGEDIKIMMMLRNPIDLLISLECQKGNAKKPFTAQAPPNISRHEASVTEPLKVWLDVFPKRSNWLFLKSEDFFEDQKKVMNKVFRFLGIEKVDVVKKAAEKKDLEGSVASESGRRRCTVAASKAERKAYFTVDDNVKDQKALEKLTMMKYDWS